MLLNSSQVSFLLSTAIIVIFTIALFLAGYVLQQQTVRSLSREIIPRMEARTKPLSQLHGLSLPSQFATAVVPSVSASSVASVASSFSAEAANLGQSSNDEKKVGGDHASSHNNQEPIGWVRNNEWKSRLRSQEQAFLSSGQERFDAEGESFFAVEKKTSGRTAAGRARTR